MKIKTTIGWNAGWLRKVVAYCCRQLDYDPGKVTAAHFSLCHNAAYRGKAYLESHSLRVKINPLNRYPLKGQQHRGLPELSRRDAVEVLVHVTAHEVAHLERYDRFARAWKFAARRDTQLERDTEQLARMALADFRQNRSGLLGGWGDAGPGPGRPAIVHQYTCARCGQVSQTGRRLSGPRTCAHCFSSFEEGASRGEFLVHQRVPSAHSPPAPEPGWLF
jgi:hypothetical protein